MTNSRNSHFLCPDPVHLVCEVFQVAQVHLDKLVLQVHKVLKVDVVNQVHPVTMVQLALLVLRVLKANGVNEVHKVCPFAENLV